jgi:predicted nucleic-acid-binding Zn-ribbon protein
MTTITVTAAFAATVSALVAASKTPWLIVNGESPLGVYESRAEARAAKSAKSLVGQIVKADAVTVNVLPEPAAAQLAAQPSAHAKRFNKAKAAKVSKVEENPLNFTVCPKCGGTELYHGRIDESTGLVVQEMEVGGCHSCDWEFDIGFLRKSTIESPCYIVWDTADKMSKQNARRKDVIAACVAKGVAFYTARTQYQLWLSAKNAS